MKTCELLEFVKSTVARLFNLERVLPSGRVSYSYIRTDFQFLLI